MKINLFASNIQQNKPNFSAKPKKVPTEVLKDLPMDKFELSENIGQILPERFEFGEIELVAKELLSKILRLELNARSFRSDLKKYYTSQNREEYRELMKEKQKANAQFSRIAKKLNINKYDYASYIEEKRDYNFYAPKIYRATSVEELEALKSRIDKNKLSKAIERLLFELIEYRKTLLK